MNQSIILSEGEEILTNKGTRVKAIRTDEGFIVACKCNNGRSPYGNICTHCYGKGYKITKLKEVNEVKYLEILKKKYYKKCKAKNTIPHPNADSQSIAWFESNLVNS